MLHVGTILCDGDNSFTATDVGRLAGWAAERERQRERQERRQEGTCNLLS